jgi:6-phosphofructokinase 1
VESGFEGLLEQALRQLNLGAVGGILDRGGTVLGTSRSERFFSPEGVASAAAILREAGMTGLVAIGGDGTMRGAEALCEAGFPVVGVPGSIDNDISGTDTSIGFDTALNTICDAVSKVRDTASSHERTFVIEVMGRSSGFLALYAGLAVGADFVAVPEIPWSLEGVICEIDRGLARGKKHTLIVVAEGCAHSMQMAADLTERGYTSRGVVLGHIQRGGAPSAFDRILASRMGQAAVTAVLEGTGGVMIGLRHSDTVQVPLSTTYGAPHALRRDIYELALRLAQ